MGRLVETLAKIFATVVKSLFVSGIMFIAFLSIVTGGFPPDFRKISRAFGGIQEPHKISHQTITKPVTEISPAAFDDEKDEEEDRIVPMRQVSSVDPSEELKNQMRDMQQEIFHLQKRVNELEGRRPKTKR